MKPTGHRTVRVVVVVDEGERRYDETLCLPNTEFWNFLFVQKKYEVEHTQN